MDVGGGVECVGCGDDDLLVSRSPDRSSPVPLEGESVTGDIFVSASPEAGVNKVSFYIDGVFHQREFDAPYDLSGTNRDVAYPFDTNELSDGLHQISALIELDGGGTEVISSIFTVANL